MLKSLRIIFVIFCTLFITSCATTKTVAYLPTGSKIALVSGFDQDITYRYASHINYVNNDFQYKTHLLTPNASILLPVKAALEKNGYRVIIVPVRNKHFLSRINFKKGELSASERDYFLSLVPERVDRVIIFTKTMSEDFNNKDNVGFGYGYLQYETDTYKVTNVFAATKMRVITMNNPDHMVSKLIWGRDQMDNRLFADEPSKVTPTSILNCNRWMHDRFSKYVIAVMASTNMIRGPAEQMA